MMRSQICCTLILIWICCTWKIVLGSSSSNIGSWTEGSPLPGTPCHSSIKDCDSETTQMLCLPQNGRHICACKQFYVVSGLNGTKPIFDKSINACVVRKGEYCETDDPDTFITCEPGTVCDDDLIPEHTDVGICVTDTSGANDRFQLSYSLIISSILAISINYLS